MADVFRKAADKVGKVGEREWRQVFEQQRYVLDELLTAQTTKDAKPFDEALSDFNFLLQKALDNLVSTPSMEAVRGGYDS